MCVRERGEGESNEGGGSRHIKRERWREGGGAQREIEN